MGSAIMARKGKYKCVLCDSNYSQKYNLKIHEDTIHKQVKFDCPDCGKQFTLKRSLTIHINSVHKGIKYKCNQCDKEFTQSANRFSHNIKDRNISVILVIRNVTVHQISENIINLNMVKVKVLHSNVIFVTQHSN